MHIVSTFIAHTLPTILMQLGRRALVHRQGRRSTTFNGQVVMAHQEIPY